MALHTVTLEQHLQLVAGTPYEDVPPAVLVHDPATELRDQWLAGVSLFGGTVEFLEAPRLTQRMNQVAGLAASGLRNKQIGAVLGLAEDTVGTNIQELFYMLSDGPHTRNGILGYMIDATEGPAIAQVTHYSQKSPLTGLSETEISIAGWLAEGKEGTDIAPLLGKTPIAIDNIIQKMKNKTKIRSRSLLAGAVVVADPLTRYLGQ